MKKTIAMAIAIGLIMGSSLTVTYFAVRQTLAMQATLVETTSKVNQVIEFINKNIEASQKSDVTNVVK